MYCALQMTIIHKFWQQFNFVSVNLARKQELYNGRVHRRSNNQQNKKKEYQNIDKRNMIMSLLRQILLLPFIFQVLFEKMSKIVSEIFQTFSNEPGTIAEQPRKDPQTTPERHPNDL